MENQCASCGSNFEVSHDDQEFLASESPTLLGKKVLIAPSRLCPECRLQQVLLWRNERTIYSTTCKLCKGNIISQYAPEKPYNAYCPECFWGDDWNSEDYAQEFDFSRPFFDQFNELLQKAPVQALVNMQCENSEYCHRIYSGRNNYLSFIALNEPENLIHTYYTMACKDSIDISQSQYCELCYDIVDAEQCYNCRHSNRIRNCKDSYFLQDCSGCTNCFGCKNLHQQSYCIFNEQKTREEYEAFITEAQLDSYANVEKMRKQATDFFATLPNREKMIINAENVTGATIYNSRECRGSFDVYEVEHAHYCLEGEKSHHMMSCMGFGENEYCYYGVTIGGSQMTRLSASIFFSSDILYSYDCCANSANCFGCVGTKKKQYCILNKQYTKEEYETLLTKIIEHMKETGEWGEFFTPDLSPFAYNETLALHHVPLQKEEVHRREWQWRDIVDEMPEVEKTIPSEKLPDAITDIPDDILNWAVECNKTKRPFRIVQQELDFYRSHGIPVPRLHPDERYSERMHLRDSRFLHDRTCAKCSKDIQTTYSPDRPETVYCEECYLAEVY